MLKLLSERKRKKQLKRQIRKIFYPLPWRDRQIKMLSRYRRLRYVPIEYRELAYKLMPRSLPQPSEGLFEDIVEWLESAIFNRNYDEKYLS